jgi:multiple antibiotic resistance protein
MTLFEFDIWQVLDILTRLLIGMGPKVALVPFLDLTANMDNEARKKIANRMVRTATVVALVLLVLRAFLMRLLHFTEPALYIAGGILFLLVTLRMLAEAGDESEDHHTKGAGRDSEKIAL